MILVDYIKLSKLLFPSIDKTPEDYETIYPARDLPEDAVLQDFCI